MPDIETLMQVWPAEFEDELKALEVPGADIDLSVQEYASVACALLDVPSTTRQFRLCMCCLHCTLNSRPTSTSRTSEPLRMPQSSPRRIRHTYMCRTLTPS